MDDPNENEISSFKRFLESYCRDVKEPSREGNDSLIRHVSYELESSEIEGESLQWALDYLCQTHNCPHGLAEHLSREVFRRVLQLDSLQSASLPRIEIQQLHQEIEAVIYKVCTEWKERLPASVSLPRLVLPISVHAIKNSRRKMEDRHVILPDLNSLFQLQDSPSQSYYAVFDGHGGPEAAMFSASQLHVNLIRDPNFNTNPQIAFKRAYLSTDEQFLRKAAEQKLRSGTTGVSVLLREDHCYFSWLGDSQVMLVRDGRAVTLMEPHKPDREDERKRIEQLGGSVTNIIGGVWRVNGSISVSRAIGDISMKPFLCSDADVDSFPLTGTEDYIVLGCDGIWDVLAPPDIPFIIHSYLQQNPLHFSSVAKHLVTRAIEMGSEDNISCIVVFMRRDIAEPISTPKEGFHLVRENGDHRKEVPEGHFSGSSRSVSRFTLRSATDVSDNVDGSKTNQRIQGDLSFRQSRVFLQSHKEHRTGHYRQQIIPLTIREQNKILKASQDVVQLDLRNKTKHNLKRKSLFKGSTSKGPVKYHLRSCCYQHCKRHTRASSFDFLRRNCVSFDPYVGSSAACPVLIVCQSVKTPLRYSNTQLQMLKTVDENSKPSNQGSVSAGLHKPLPRFCSCSFSSLLSSVPAKFPLTTSHHSNLHNELLLPFPFSERKSVQVF